jgi:predicted phosphodiesterase
VEAERTRIALLHDAGPRRGRLERLRRRFGDRAQAVVFGHSHLPLHETCEDGFQIFNPGSPTDRRRAPAYTMGIARVDGRRVEFELIELG